MDSKRRRRAIQLLAVFFTVVGVILAFFLVLAWLVPSDVIGVIGEWMWMVWELLTR